MFGLGAGVIALLVILMVGLPAIELVARVRMPRRRRPASLRDAIAEVNSGPAFVPLTLSDSGMRWPSQTPPRTPALMLPPWPSQSWSYNPFPASFGKGPDAALLAEGVARRTQPEYLKRMPVAAQAVPVAADPIVASKPPVASAPRTRPSTAAKPAVRAQARPAGSTSAVTDAPADSEVIRVADQQGLAAAVDYVRQQTGWPFQRAAQHVAMALRGHT